MNLRGSLTKLLKGGSVFYKERARLFEHNPVIRDAWLQFSQDMEQQVAGLRELPPAFWREVEPLEKSLAESVRACLDLLPKRNNNEVPSLQSAMCQTLSCAEPVILHVFAPLIRKLRTSWSNRSLGFYVIVKAHVTHVNRLIETYCGDPILIQKAANLMEAFEREAQEPEIVPVQKARRIASSSPKARKSAKVRTKRSAGALKTARASLSRPAAKPVVRKMTLARRRASR